MTVVIALRPHAKRGQGILDALEERRGMQPMQRLQDGTRRYRLEDADVAEFDPMLDQIDPDWRNHITNWRE